MDINYVIGNATEPEVEGLKFIIHCCNNEGAWGRGFVLALSRRWGMPELVYKKWANERPDELKESLGKIQVIPVEKEIMVVNLIGQDGIGIKNGLPPVRYDAISLGLTKAQQVIEGYENKDPSVHMPRLGCSLAGGSWAQIEKIIKETIKVPVYVYDLVEGGDYNP
jgi:O-acetyl-ADP-ribose deacetylase (regulator of RNase III)